MPFRICKSFEIESGHLLSKHPGKCRFPHGHSRRIEVVLTAVELDGNDMVCDFKALKQAMESFLDHWDHALLLNTDDPQFAQLRQIYGQQVVAFAQTDPTSEVLARTVFEEVARRLRESTTAKAGLFSIAPNVRVERVRVTETSSSWAEYFDETALA